MAGFSVSRSPEKRTRTCLFASSQPFPLEEGCRSIVRQLPYFLTRVTYAAAAGDNANVILKVDRKRSVVHEFSGFHVGEGAAATAFLSEVMGWGNALSWHEMHKMYPLVSTALLSQCVRGGFDLILDPAWQTALSPGDLIYLRSVICARVAEVEKTVKVRCLVYRAHASWGTPGYSTGRSPRVRPRGYSVDFGRENEDPRF